MEDLRIIFKEGRNPSDLDNGLKSTFAWDQAMPYLRIAFRCSDDEQIIGVIVNKDGISAKFEKK